MEVFDRALLELLIDVISKTTPKRSELKEVLNARGKELGLKKDAYLRKLDQGNISWKTFLLGIRILDLDKVKLIFNLKFKIAKERYGPKKKVEVDIKDPELELVGQSDIRDVCDSLLEASGTHQVVFVNRARLSYTNKFPDMPAKAIEHKTKNLIRRLQGSSITWNTLIELLNILEVKDATIAMEAYKDKSKITTKDIALKTNGE